MARKALFGGRSQIWLVTFETGLTEGYVRREVAAPTAQQAKKMVERDIADEGGVVIEVEPTFNPPKRLTRHRP